MKKIINFLTGFVLLFIFSSTSHAAYINQDIVVLPKDTLISESYFATGKTLKIDGNIAGDLICAGQDVEITGSVDGDVICVGQMVRINGIVTGNVRVAGQYVDINAYVGRNTSVAGQKININDKSKLQGELFFAGESVYLNGSVGKKVWGGANVVDILGSLKRDVTIHAKILNQDPQAKVDGKVYFTKIVEKQRATEENTFVENKKMDNGTSSIGGMIVSFILGLLAIFLLRENIEKSIKMMNEKKWPSVGWGVLYLILSPILIVLMAITIIGIPLAILSLIFFMATFVVAYIYFAIFIGRKIILNYWKDKKNSLPWALFVGVVVNGALFMIPVVGGIYKSVALVWGFGGMILVFKNRNKK